MPKSFSCTVDNSLCQSLWRRVKARRYDLRHHRELVNERISRRGLLIIENLMSGSRGRLASREIKSRGQLGTFGTSSTIFSYCLSPPPLAPRSHYRAKKLFQQRRPSNLFRLHPRLQMLSDRPDAFPVLFIIQADHVAWYSLWAICDDTERTCSLGPKKETWYFQSVKFLVWGLCVWWIIAV